MLIAPHAPHQSSGGRELGGDGFSPLRLAQALKEAAAREQEAEAGKPGARSSYQI